jgi:ubiquinone/menaquinone biosynthesis C-methylase UbiE
MIDVVASALGFGSGWGGKALARTLGKEKVRVAALSEPVARAIEQAGHEAVRVEAQNGRLPLDDRSCDALCASGLPPTDVAPAVLRECARVVKPGGRVLIATPYGITRRGPERHVVTAMFLHASLTDVTQKMSRGIVITSGLVRSPV